MICPTLPYVFVAVSRMRNISFFIVQITSFIELYFLMLFPSTRILG